MSVLNWWILKAEYALPDTYVHTYVSYAYSHTGVHTHVHTIAKAMQDNSEISQWSNAVQEPGLHTNTIHTCWPSSMGYKAVCTQLTKAYVAKTPCSQLLLIEFATYIRTYMLKINLLVIKHCWEWSVLLKQLPSMCLVIYVYACVLSRRHYEIK